MNTPIFIIDNNIIVNDSDSDTSSISTAEEILTYNNFKSNTNIKSQLMEIFIKPIQSYMYLDKDKSQEIIDGFELSLLRLVHIWVSIDGIINFEYLTKHMDLSTTESKELEDFFFENPGVMIDSDFYITDAGIKIRKAWYNFLSNRNFFNYINKFHQLVPDNENFYQFIKYFFPLIKFNENSNNDEIKKLNIIYNSFSTNLYKFHVNYLQNTQIEDSIIYKNFKHNIFVNNTELFIFIGNIKQFVNSNQIIWSKTELKYC